MLAAIQFHNKLSRRAEKIHDIRANRLLPVKAKMRHLLAAQECPKLSLCLCCV
jgi:hypothetical protein